jgi:hypothetical protein
MDIKEDSSGNRYIDVGHWTRITFVSGALRLKEQNWAGCDALRIQTYRSHDSGQLHMGVEIPLRGMVTVIEFIQAIVTLVRSVSE